MKLVIIASTICLATLPTIFADPGDKWYYSYTQKPARSYLGIGIREIDEQRAKALNLKEEYGVEVKSVEKESPAEKAGLKEGDVLLEYNGQRVEGGEQFQRMVRETPVGRHAKLLVWRNGATQTVTATIGERKYQKPPFLGTLTDLPQLEFDYSQIVPPDLPHPLMSWRTSVVGIEGESLSSQLAEFFGVKEGVLVRAVTKGSPAEKAGIKAGDVVVKVQDTKVSAPQDISRALRVMRDRISVPVTVVRDKKEIVLTISVALGGQERRENVRL